MNNKINICYIGSSDFSTRPLMALSECGEINVKCIITLPDRISGRKNKPRPTPVKTVALNLDLPFIETEDLKSDSLLSGLKDLNLHFIVVCSFAKMIPGRLLKLPDYFCINIHPSLLPLYRGAAPISRALMDGEKKTGTTFFKMNKKLDSGKILFQQEIDIDYYDDYISLSNKLSSLSAENITRSIKSIYNGNYSLKPQYGPAATYAGPILKSECLIDWELDAETIDNKIKGLNGYLPAYTYYKNKRLQITRSAIDNIKTHTKTSGPSGTIFVYDRSLFVKCGNNTLLHIIQVKPEGKNLINAFDFVQGYRISSESSMFTNTTKKQ